MHPRHHAIDLMSQSPDPSPSHRRAAEDAIDSIGNTADRVDWSLRNWGRQLYLPLSTLIRAIRPDQYAQARHQRTEADTYQQAARASQRQHVLEPGPHKIVQSTQLTKG
jgi:hypothetical protein